MPEEASQFVLPLLGAAVLAAVLWDIVVTTITSRGAGPITSWSAHWLWSCLLRGHRPGGSHRLLANGGVAVVISSILIWVALLWAGWSLVFMGGDMAVVSATSGEPAGAWARIYFAGYTLFTLGLGDYKPGGASWQILTNVCAANGLLALTLSVTYLVPVLSAVVQKRQLAATIAALGGTPEEILRRTWNGRDFSGLNQPLTQLYPGILMLAQQHLAYPSLHYLHAGDPRSAIPIRLAALDEALSVLSYAIRTEARPDATAIAMTREAIALFLQVLESAHIRAAEEAPSIPSLHDVPAAALVDDARAALEAGAADLAPRRRLMRGLVENDGWTWTHVGHSHGSGRTRSRPAQTRHPQSPGRELRRGRGGG